MQTELGTTLRGSWTMGKELSQIDNMGGGIKASVWGERALVLQSSRPGLHPLYYSVLGGSIHWDEQAFRLHRKMRGLGQTRPTVTIVEGGDRVTFDGRTLATTNTPITVPRWNGRFPTSMRDAQDEMEAALLSATQEIYNAHGRGPVTLLLSGGVDSIAILWALKTIGADVYCVTAGMSEDEFDPKWAKIAADHFDTPWQFIRIPSDPEALQKVLQKTVGIIEQTSFSNVLMGICCALIQDWMATTHRKVAYTGFWGDLLFGHKLQVTGSFNQLPAHEKTDEEWTRRRVTHCWHSKDHSLQLAKGLRHGGETTWRVPFVHETVANYAFNLPLEFAPSAMDKPLLYGMMDRYIPHDLAAWHTQKKIGFYTGAGIGKERLRNPILQDENIRATFRAVKAHLS